MPTSNALSRVGSVDFFGVLAPGFYAVLAAAYAFNDFNDMGSPTLWGRLLPLASALKENPVTILFLLFAAYMIGAMIRVIPVDLADKNVHVWIGYFKRIVSLLPWRGDEKPEQYSGTFPFDGFIKDVWASLNRQKDLTKLDDTKLPQIGSLVEEHVFDYWKNYLCIWSTKGFAESQSLEARVRFFVGMVWAGCLGLLGGCVAFSKALWRHQDLLPGLCLFLASLEITVAFGLYLRRVRFREVRGVYLLYVACRYDSPNPGPQGAADTTAGPQQAKVDD